MSSVVKRVIRPLLPVDSFTKADRRIVFTIWMAGLIQGFAQAQTSASLPYTRVGLGLTEGEMSLLLGLARLGAFIALPIGWLADRHGRRRPFLVSMTLIVLGGAVAGLTVEAWQFGLSHAVLRTGTAAVSGLALVILSETVSRPVRSYSISFYGAAVSLGSGMALLALPLAENGAEAWRTPHLLIGAGFLIIPVLIKRVPETRVYEKESEVSRWREMITTPWAPRFWTVMAIGFLASAYGTVGTSFSTERLINQVGLASGTTVAIVLGAGTVAGLGFFIGGWMADAWGRRPGTVFSLLLATAGGITLYTVETIPILVVGVFMSSFGTFALVPAAGAHRTELFPTTLRSSANTAVAHAAMVGSSFGLIFGIFTIDTLGLTSTIMILAVGMVVAALLTLRLPETKGQDLTAVSTDPL